MISTILLITLSIILLYVHKKYLSLRVEINANTELMNLILSNIGDGVVVGDASGRTIIANSIVKNISGMEVNNLSNVPYDSLLEIIRKKISENSGSGENNSLVYDNGEHGCTNYSEKIIKNKNGEVSTKIAILHNLFECSTSHQIIHRMAHYDSLTELPNRNHIKEILAKSIATSKEKKDYTAVAFIDLDNFKMINDTMGHDIGDLVLKHISSVIHECLGNSAYAGRLGGDEFIVVMPGISNITDSIRKIKGLLKNLNNSISIDDKEVYITASAGIAVYPLHGTTPKDLLKNADTAMYAAKNKGKMICLLYREEMNIQNIRKYEMINDLKKALYNNEFKLFYQPKIDINSNKIVGLEALIRWIHPEKGIIPPSDFIPLAEETGFILPLGEWALREACSQNKKWQGLGYAPIKIAVNISTQQFQHESFIGTVRKILQETNLEPRLLELEITESIAVTCFECALIKLKQLKKLGVTIAIDDFGTGYSSFNYLRLLPIDTFKIDKIFLDNLMTHPNEQLITASMIDLGKRLNLSVVAEGVEHDNQVIFLKKHGCNIAQGYLFSKPVPVEDIERLLQMNL